MYQAFQGDHPQAFLPISVLKFIFFVSKVSDVDMGAVFRMVESVVLRACHNVRNSGILHVGPMELLAYCLKLLSLMDTHGYGKETGFSTKETRDIIVETSSEILSMIWRPVTWRILETEAATQTELSVLRSMLFPSLAFSHPLLCWPIGNLGCNQACMEYRDNRKFEMRLTLAIRPAHAAPVWRITQGFMMMRVFESRKFGEISSTALKGIGMAVAEDLGCVCYNSDDVHGGSNDHQGFVLVVSSKLALKYMINSVG
ncbi:hypothetical protein BDR26DRAFT_874824 [Obelidium mucronatum]|nr:hypothetical protein BDR26DRAFT_874824 [Obelidium mucronatum]